jgi:hypothetical protein
MRTVALMLGCFFLLCGCGQQELSEVATSLLIPRQLGDRVKKIEVYCFETSASRPRCDELSSSASFEDYRKQAFAKLTLSFPGQNTAVFEGIPDHGTVWRFYARGYDATDGLIAQGCTPGLYEIKPGRDTQIDITLNAY